MAAIDNITAETIEQIETWKPLPGYEGYYSVSDLGRIKSHHFYKGTSERIVASRVVGRGYYGLALSREGIKKWYLVHCLVMKAFVGDCPDGMQVNHVNCKKSDNRLCNLEYCTRLENMKHAVKNGLTSKGRAHGDATKAKIPRGDNHFYRKHPERIKRGKDHCCYGKPNPGFAGENNPFAKLNKGKVMRIRHLAETETPEKIAQEFGISTAHAIRVILKKVWKHV